MIWNDELPTKEGKYLLIDLAEEAAGTRHEVEIFRKDLVLDGNEVSEKIATGDFTGYWTFLPRILERMVDDIKTENIVIDYKNEHIIFKNVLHVRLDDGREMPLFEAEGMNLWAEV